MNKNGLDIYVHDRSTRLAYDVEFPICEGTVSMMNLNDWIFIVRN